MTDWNKTILKLHAMMIETEKRDQKCYLKVWKVFKDEFPEAANWINSMDLTLIRKGF